MLKRILAAFLLISLTAIHAVCAEPASVYMENQTSIRIDRSQPSFSLKLKSNPTTGYSWFLLNYDKGLIKPTGHEYIKPDSKMVGQGGYEIWSFEVLFSDLNGPKNTKILMEYKRPWEIAGSSKKVAYLVTID